MLKERKPTETKTNMVQRAGLQHKNEAHTLFGVLVFLLQLYISNFLLQYEQFIHIHTAHSTVVSSHPILNPRKYRDHLKVSLAGKYTFFNIWLC